MHRASNRWRRSHSLLAGRDGYTDRRPLAPYRTRSTLGKVVVSHDEARRSLSSRFQTWHGRYVWIDLPLAAGGHGCAVSFAGNHAALPSFHDQFFFEGRREEERHAGGL